MKFVVSRTSLWQDERPCDEAKLERVESWHTRTCTEEVFNAKFSKKEGLWRDSGTEHTVTKAGHITKRVEDDDAWVIEIKSLAGLVKFMDKYGSCIIDMESDYSPSKLPTIEIYDDYRE